MRFSVGSGEARPPSWRPLTLAEARLRRVNDPPNLLLLQARKQRAVLSYPTEVLETLIARLTPRVRELTGLTQSPADGTTGETWLHAMSRLDEAEATLAACSREVQKRAVTSDGNTDGGAGCASGSAPTRSTPSGQPATNGVLPLELE